MEIRRWRHAAPLGRVMHQPPPQPPRRSKPSINPASDELEEWHEPARRADEHLHQHLHPALQLTMRLWPRKSERQGRSGGMRAAGSSLFVSGAGTLFILKTAVGLSQEATETT